MKQESEESLKNAFRTMMNKLSFTGDVLLDVWAKELAAAESSGKKEKLRTLRQRLLRIGKERKSLSDRIVRGCGEPVPFHRRLTELEAEENLVNAEIAHLTCESERMRAVRELREALLMWNGDADQVFPSVVGHAVVETGERVTFHLRCGLRLTESLRPVASAAEKSR